MGFIDLPQLRDQHAWETDQQYNRYLVNMLAVYRDELDTIVNGGLNFKNIKADGITTKNLAAGSVIAEKIDVDKLSAITADLGEIIAGIIRGIKIYGSYIATADGTYPRAEMSSDDNFFKASNSANQYISILPYFLGNNAPQVDFVNIDITSSASMFINALNGQFSIISPRSIFISAGGSTLRLSGAFVSVPDWASFRDASTSQTLQQTLDGLNILISGKANAFSGYTGTFTVDGKTLTFSNGVLTSVV